ncbi:hypothetical protein CVIRNUC_007195 [Coccomyxa viridis]|uniref:Uncharacterized protein n=1 Tax=Coccomyxa viridis TaxID=1274662 RepID=A0AAV1IA69_9CHLO|nr:hypothetical protein CVIRNUC_007195 [Coccomyxa viridis]
MARGRRHKHANSLKKEAKKASGREKAQASQPANSSSIPDGIQTHTHISAERLLDARPPSCGDGRMNNQAPPSDGSTMAFQAKLLKQLSVAVDVRAGGTQSTESGAADSIDPAHNVYALAPAQTMPARKGCMLLRPLTWATSCVGSAFSLAQRTICAPARLALAPFRAAAPPSVATVEDTPTDIISEACPASPVAAELAVRALQQGRSAAVRLRSIMGTAAGRHVLRAFQRSLESAHALAVGGAAVFATAAAWSPRIR